MKFIFIFLAAVLVNLHSTMAFAQDHLIEYTEEGRSESEDSVQQRQDIIQDAIEKVSNKLIRELIGDAKFDKQATAIKAKVLPQSDKYIPFVKTGSSRTDGTQTRMNVTLKISQKSLESVLQQAGLLSSTDGSATLLPVVSFSDFVNHKSFQWWMSSADDPNTFLKSQERLFFESLKNNFSKIGFQILDPVSSQLKKNIPLNLQIEALRTQDYSAMAEALKAQLVLKGEIRIEAGKLSQSYRITSRFTVLHSGNGRVVADSLRTVETESGLFTSVVGKKMQLVYEDINQDLAAQVNEAWTRGTFGANLIRLAIKGNFDYKTLEGIKEDIKTQVRTVRSISERLFARNLVEFDVDVEGGAEALAKAIGQLKWRAVQLRVDSTEAGKVTLR